MSREKEFAKNTVIIGIGTIIPKLTSLITLPILTACLTKNDYGTYDLINTIISLILPVATLKIEMAVFRFLLDCRNQVEKTQEVVSTAFVFDFIVALLITTVYGVISKSISIETRILIGVYFLLDSLVAVVLQTMRGFSKNLIYSISAIINAVVNMLLIVATVKFAAMGINGVLISACFSSAVIIFIGFIWGGVKDSFNIRVVSTKTLREMLKYSWPLVPNSLSLWIMNLSDRFIITFFLGIEANAVYAVANKIPQLFNIVQSSVVTAWQENASLASKDKDIDQYYSRVFDDIYSITTGAMALLIAATPIFFKILIRGDYGLSYFQMPILLLGMFFSSLSSFMGGIYCAHKRTNSVGITTLIAAIINASINFLFVQKIGIYAGSISTMISFMYLTIYRMIDVLKFQKIRYNIKRCLLLFAGLVGMCILTYQNNVILDLVNIGIGIFFAFVINRKNLVVIFNAIKRKIKR